MESLHGYEATWYVYYHNDYYVTFPGQVSQEESLFFYPGFQGRRKRQTYDEFQNLDFVPIFRDELNFTDDQEQACEGNAECLFDLAVTGDMEFANNTLNQDKFGNETKEVLSKG